VEATTVDLVALEMNLKKKKKILNKLTLEILVAELVAAAELTQAAELILNQELVKALVDLVMVKDQDKVLDKV
jgi:hypothetical protein